MTGERIAELRDRAGGVRWQNPKDVVWNEARAGQSLYDGQSVMTLADSTARLVFDAQGDSSAEIDVGPKTLLQVQAKRTQGDRPLLLSLSRGSIRANTKRALELAAGEFTVHIDSGSRFEAENIGAGNSRTGHAALRLKMQSGGARSGNSVVARDQTIEIPILTREESAREPDVSPVILETEAAPTPAPSAVPSASPSPTPSPRAARARVLPPPKVQSPVLRRRAPKPSPAPGASFFDLLFPSAYAAEDENEWDIELRWDPVPSAKEYRVEVSRTRNFASRIAEDSAKDPHWTLAYRRGMENSKGRIFYRIASVDENGKVGKFSDPKPFTIPSEILHPVAAAAPAPAPPVAKSVAAPSPPKPVSETGWTFRPAAEMTSLTETSDYPQLRRVGTGSAYLHEAYAISRESPAIRFAASLRTNHFKSDPGILPKSRSYRAALGGERATTLFGGRLYFGAVAVFEDHFVKTGADSIALARGVSIGPSATLAKPLWSVALRLPLSGMFGSGTLAGPYGPTLRLERDWELTPNFRISLSGEGSYHLWKSEPSSTTAKVTEWSIGFGPKVILR